MLGNEEKQMIIGLLPFFSENPTIIDVGSNKGHFTELILDEFKDKCQVHLFEPNEMLLNYTRIRFEYKFNLTYNSLIAYKENGVPLSFYYFNNYNNELSSIYKDDEGWKELPMKEKKENSIRIDTYCDKNKIDSVDFIKIDCEGSDVDVLLGCEDLMKRNEVKFIQIEYGGHYQRANKTFLQVFDIIEKYGYKCYSFDGNYWEVKRNDFVEDYRFENFIITKEEIHNYSYGGWNNEFIINTAELQRMDLVIEQGCFEGLTTKYICENLLNEGGRVITIDPHWDYYYDGDNGAHPYFKGQYNRFLRNTRGLPVEHYRMTTKEAMPKLAALRADLIYVDGDHRPEWIYHDCVWAFATTKIGGHILIDDVNTWAQPTKESVYKFINEFRGSLEIVIETYQVLVKKTANQYNEITYEFYK